MILTPSTDVTGAEYPGHVEDPRAAGDPDPPGEKHLSGEENDRDPEDPREDVADGEIEARPPEPSGPHHEQEASPRRTQPYRRFFWNCSFSLPQVVCLTVV